jgi:hypothetical protein
MPFVNRGARDGRMTDDIDDAAIEWRLSVFAGGEHFGELRLEAGGQNGAEEESCLQQRDAGRLV